MEANGQMFMALDRDPSQEETERLAAAEAELKSLQRDVRKLSSAQRGTKLPAEWAREQGIEILDPDGWRGPNGRPFDEPVTLEEFNRRVPYCTLRNVIHE